jgi:hypothetical protein
MAVPRYAYGLAALCVAILVSCRDEGISQPPVTPEPPVEQVPGIYPTIILSAHGDHTDAALVLKRVQVGDRVAGFQGELTYDRARLHLLSTDFPSGVSGMVNEQPEGTLRFAGASLQGLPDEVAFVMHLSAAPSSADLVVRLQEVSAAETLANITGRVIVAPHPQVEQGK